MAMRADMPLSQPQRLFIGGDWVDPSSDALIDVFSPGTEELYLQVANASEADVNRAVAAARDAFDNGPWPRMSHQERAGWMNKIADELTRRSGDIAQIWPNEMGILHSMASAFAPGAGHFYRYYAALADTFPFEEECKTVSGAKTGLWCVSRWASSARSSRGTGRS